ncbi:MAG TPA: outer membrane beta-barrel protein [Terriglobales bacterium]|nr:outer membrane beta-barrel protein [Terriglobales bacterium]
MIRKLTVVLALLVLGSLAAQAQQGAGKIDLFGGYSYFDGSTSGNAGRYGLNGWNGQATYNFSRWLGATADFGGYYGSPFSASSNDYTFLFGPTVSIGMGHVTPFAHALFGVDRFHTTVVGGSGTDSSFAMAVGGGLDVPVKGIFAIRAAQLDWLRTSHFSNSQNNLRVSTGVVFRFGE